MTWYCRWRFDLSEGGAIVEPSFGLTVSQETIQRAGMRTPTKSNGI